MKKFLIAAFFGILGMCGTEMPVIASSIQPPEGNNDNDNKNDDNDDDSESTKRRKAAETLLKENPKGLLDEESIRVVVDEVYLELQKMNKTKEGEEETKKVIKFCIDKKNRNFNVFYQIDEVNRRGAGLPTNIKTIARVIGNGIGGDRKDGLRSKDTNLEGRQGAVRVGGLLAHGARMTTDEKEGSKAEKYSVSIKLLNDFNESGLKATTTIMENLCNDDFSKVVEFTKNDLVKNVEGVEACVRALNTKTSGQTKRGKQDKDIAALVETKERMLKLLETIKGSLQNILLKAAENSAEGLYASIAYLWSLQQASTGSNEYLGSQEAVVTPSRLLDFYIQCKLGGYEKVGSWKDIVNKIRSLNEEIKAALKHDEVKGRLKELYKDENGTGSDDESNYLINESHYTTCVNWWHKKNQDDDSLHNM